MLQAGVDPVTVAKRGGWKTPAQLFATYGHASDDDSVLDALIGKPKAKPTIGRRKAVI